MAANYTSSDGFLDQFKDQLRGDENKQKPEENGGEAHAQQGEWTQEQIQQYYQQYGYPAGSYDYSQYGYPAAPGPDGQPGVPQMMAPMPHMGMPPYGYYGGFPGGFPPDPASAHYYGYGGYSGYGSGYGTDERAQQPAPGEPSRSVWLGNINPDTTEGELTAAFAPYGMIEHVKILPAKNCAFVRFVELDAAIRAHSGMFGATIHGQQIKIGWGKAEPVQKEETGPPPCRNLWLGNINPEISEEQIRSAFSTFGTIEKVRIIPAKNCAFVNFSTLDAAMNAKNQMQGATLIDRPVKINFGKETTKEGDKKDSGIGDLSKPLEPERPKIPAPPPQGPPPENPDDKLTIDKLAEYVAKNGLKFEYMMQDKQKENPKYKFIEEGHPHNSYYRFRIWQYRYPDANPADFIEPPKPVAPYGAVPPPSSLQAPLPPPIGDQPPIPPDFGELYELAGLLDHLTPTKDSIKESKTWIIERRDRAKQIADFVHAKFRRITAFDKKLNVIYLLHDLLHHSSRERAEGETTDAFADAFLPYLPDILQMAAKGAHPDNQDKILKVVRIWDEKKIFDPNLLQQWIQGMEIQERGPEPERSRDSGSSRHRSPRDRGDDRKRREKDRDRDRDRDYKHRRH